MFNLWLDYPSFDEEVTIVKSTTSEINPTINKLISDQEIIEFQDLIRRVPVADNVVNFAVNLVRASRPTNGSSKLIKEFLSYGAGPRASQYLILGAKSRAALQGRFTPDIEDVKNVALPVLRHRIVTNFKAEADNVSQSEIIEQLISENS
jgi:MoxR-like ATPase